MRSEAPARPAKPRGARAPARVEVLGIRHHGPGSARAVLRALEALQPTCVLIEGPADADPVLSFAGAPAMRAPVALLVHAVEDPASAVFYPYSDFSPEWVALRWAHARGIPVRFIDLPVALALGLPDGERGRRREDPLGGLAAAAGEDDVDRFWERLIEDHRPDTGPEQALAHFRALHSTMEAAREAELVRGTTPLREQRREAHMRLQIHKAARDHDAIAVLVGAWHTPALRLAPEALANPLRRLPTMKDDEALIKGLTRHKTHVAWVPWTHVRLSAESGYGAGVRSPGWYQHLFEVSALGAAYTPGPGWAVRAARLLRGQDLSASVADAVEVVRLADALAALRERTTPSLDELREAILAVLCQGEPQRLALIEQALEVGDALGAVPPNAPATPLRRDLTAQAKALALKPTVDVLHLHLDLRKERDLGRTRLLHRLELLQISWGKRVAESGAVGAGTFKELWDLRWDPAFEVELALASRWGNTVALATSACVIAQAATANLGELAELLGRALDADLPDACTHLLTAIGERAADTHDLAALGRALLPLARLVRYSDVRQTTAAAVWPIFEGLFWRLVAGFLPASRGLDDAAAALRLEDLDAVELALGLLASGAAPAASAPPSAPAHTDAADRTDATVAAPDLAPDPAPDPAPDRTRDDLPAMRAAWDAMLRDLATDASPLAGTQVHERIAGRATRLLLQHGELAPDELETLAHLSLSGGHVDRGPARAAAWIEGLIEGSGLLLATEDALWSVLDRWLHELDEPAFVEVLPILRRGFSAFSADEKRRMAHRLAQLVNPSKTKQLVFRDIDPARVAKLLAPLRLILAPPPPASPSPESPDER